MLTSEEVMLHDEVKIASEIENLQALTQKARTEGSLNEVKEELNSILIKKSRVDVKTLEVMYKLLKMEEKVYTNNPNLKETEMLKRSSHTASEIKAVGQNILMPIIERIWNNGQGIEGLSVYEMQERINQAINRRQ